MTYSSTLSVYSHMAWKPFETPLPNLRTDRELLQLSQLSVRTLRYRYDVPSFPASRPVDFPHIVDIEPVFDDETDCIELRLCDSVATLLFRHDRNLLYQFFDLSVPEFFFLREVKDPEREDLVIWRMGKTVMVSPIQAYNRFFSTMHS